MISGLGDSPYLSSCLPGRRPPADGEKQAHIPSADSFQISEQARGCYDGDAAHEIGGVRESDLKVNDEQALAKLKKRDQEVKAHERAHMSAGADVVAGGASYEYERGPDGKMYAVGGEVKIDTSKENDPQATIRKMQKIKKAALAPAQPSATDRNVAAQACQMEAEARIELAKQKESADPQQEGERRSNPVHLPLKNLSIYKTPPAASRRIQLTA